MTCKLLFILGAAARIATHGHGMNIIDTHVHNTFATSKLSYTFPKAFPNLSSYTWNMSEYVAATGQRSISAILMELDKEGDLYSESLLEAKLFQETANYCRASHGFCSVAGIVSSAPVTSGAVIMRRFLKDLKREAPMVCGVRESIWKKPSSYFVNQTYYDSLRELAAYDLTLDLLVNRTQLADIRKLAIALPDLRININHVGYPDVKGDTFDKDWADGMRSLAALPNVYAKLSGLPQAYGGKGWSAVDFQPYITHVLKEFGPNRTNFAGNWFVLNEFGDYTSMLSTVSKCLSRDLDSTAIQEVMGGTAMRLYRLGSLDNAHQQYV